MAFTARQGTAFTTRQGFRDDDFGNETDDTPFKTLTAAEAAALQARMPQLSPWRVVAAQAGLGAVIAAVAWLLTGSSAVAASALYGALVVVLPGALMARGTTSPISRLSPLIGAVSVLCWAAVKMGASVLLLALASKVVQPLSWPVLLIALVLCLQVYWFALLWRGRSQD